MKTHKVKLPKSHKLIDALSQCFDFIHGEYGVLPSDLRHNNLDAIRECAFSSLRDSTIKIASVQKIYGMDVKEDRKLKPNIIVMTVRDNSNNGKVVDAVKITLPAHDKGK